MIEIALSPERARAVHEVDLDGASYRLTLTWRESLGAWYADLATASGSPIVVGQRVSPGGEIVPDKSIPGAPRGILLAQGPDPYKRGDLGGSLVIGYLSTSEIEAARGGS